LTLTRSPLQFAFFCAKARGKRLDGGMELLLQLHLNVAVRFFFAPPQRLAL
jgi:hypothetical protein